jgi:hypothetical protein
MRIAIPSTSETFEAQVIADERGVLHLLQLRPRVDYLLAAMLKSGWRIVDATPSRAGAARGARIR